jgi:hypothetical protein
MLLKVKCMIDGLNAFIMPAGAGHATLDLSAEQNEQEMEENSDGNSQFHISFHHFYANIITI